MNFSKIIEVDIWSSFGCFSKPFSNSGGMLTYLIPPKTSIIGMVGAILGYDFDSYKEHDNIKEYLIENLQDIKISIQPLFELNTKRVTFNRVSGNTDDITIENIHQDILINPYYKLFIAFPEDLKNEEELFLDRIKNHKTIYNLYMGRNEFPLSYKLRNIFNYESIFLNKDNIYDFFKKDNMKIYGSLNRKFIKGTELKSVDNNEIEGLIFDVNKKNEHHLKSFYEYIIKEYPIKRTNFIDFKYSDLSFYSANNLKDCFFSNLILKDNLENNQGITLSKIGENEWISMI